LARAMGGSLTFANREGGGALATLSLVLDSISTSDSHDKIRVLLVEDDALSRTLIARMLALAGCDVTEAAGFDSAMVAVERQAIDLAVIDARLSEQSGTALARRIQAMSGAMIVVMSASLDRALELEATDLAPIALLQKPVTQEALLEVLSVVPQSGSVCASGTTPRKFSRKCVRRLSVWSTRLKARSPTATTSVKRHIASRGSPLISAFATSTPRR
jgi:DNA-binding response OmpR family regulator